MGMAVTNQNLIQEEILVMLKVQSLLSSDLLYKNIKMRIYKASILPVVLHG
jgi:hypothetical protein